VRKDEQESGLSGHSDSSSGVFGAGGGDRCFALAQEAQQAPQGGSPADIS